MFGSVIELIWVSYIGFLHSVWQYSFELYIENKVNAVKILATLMLHLPSYLEYSQIFFAVLLR